MPRRKIPARKHRGIRDPLIQAQERFEKIKDKIDNPPTKADDQKISNSLRRFMKLKNSVKYGKIPKVRHGIEDIPRDKKSRPIKKLPDLKPRANESDRQFLRRVNQVTKESMAEAKYEAKYGVDVMRDKKTGEVLVKNRTEDHLPTNRKLKKKFVLTDEQKAQIKEQIKKKKEEKKLEKDGRFEEFKRDEFKFGEVVHAPPVLSTIPRMARNNESTTGRPGKRELLLSKLIKSPEDTTVDDKSPKIIFSKSTNKKVSDGVVDMKGKRKDLPAGTRAMLERERQNTVNMYRMLKKRKMKEDGVE